MHLHTLSGSGRAARGGNAEKERGDAATHGEVEQEESPEEAPCPHPMVCQVPWQGELGLCLGGEKPVAKLRSRDAGLI